MSETFKRNNLLRRRTTAAILWLTSALFDVFTFCVSFSQELGCITNCPGKRIARPYDIQIKLKSNIGRFFPFLFTDLINSKAHPPNHHDPTIVSTRLAAAFRICRKPFPVLDQFCEHQKCWWSDNYKTHLLWELLSSLTKA